MCYQSTQDLSRNDIRRELILDEGDAVAQVQLALFQPLDLQHIRARGHLEGLDRGVQVAVLLKQARQLGAELAFFLTCHVPQRFERPARRAQSRAETLTSIARWEEGIKTAEVARHGYG